jgi:hypothetical protein
MYNFCDLSEGLQTIETGIPLAVMTYSGHHIPSKARDINLTALVTFDPPDEF